MESTKRANAIGVANLSARHDARREIIALAKRKLEGVLTQKSPMYGNFKVAESAIGDMAEYGAPPDYYYFSKGMPYVVAAVEQNMIRIVEVMHRHGLDVRASGPEGENIISMDIKENRGAHVKMLLDFGGDSKAVQNGIPAIIDAEFYHEACGDSKAVIRQLKDAGADIMAVDKFGRDILIVAVEHNNLERMKELMAMGAVLTERCRNFAADRGMDISSLRNAALLRNNP
jgi:hypothetical protein